MALEDFFLNNAARAQFFLGKLARELQKAADPCFKVTLNIKVMLRISLNKIQKKLYYLNTKFSKTVKKNYEIRYILIKSYKCNIRVTVERVIIILYLRKAVHTFGKQSIVSYIKYLRTKVLVSVTTN